MLTIETNPEMSTPLVYLFGATFLIRKTTV